MSINTINLNNTLIARNRVKANNIQPYTPNGAITIEGFTAYDDTVTVKILLDETTISIGQSKYVFIADRDYDISSVVSALVIPATNATIELAKVSTTGASTTVVLSMDASAAQYVTTTYTLTGATTLNKGESLYVAAHGADISNLVGFAATVILTQVRN